MPMSAILTPQSATPRCKATVELCSTVLRPYTFRVTVIGEYPHAYRRLYTVVGPAGASCEDAADSCALKGLELFVAEFSAVAVRENTGTAVPRVKLA